MEEQATSFGNVAESYDRVRPGPPAEALDWLVPVGCGLAVDLAAGTGLFTRALAGRAAQVVAIEPDRRMRAELARQSPQVRVLEGWGEEMPLPDGCADAVFVSTAWHWLDPARAVPEIARVLRPGGRLGVVWTSRDRGQDWVAELDLLRLPGVSGPQDSDGGGGRARTLHDVRAMLDREHSVTLPDGACFRDAEGASFRFTRTLPVEDVVEWLATNSAFITASAADRAAGLDRCRAALLNRTGGASAIDMPMRSWCWRATRRPRLPKAAGMHKPVRGRTARPAQALPFACGNGVRGLVRRAAMATHGTAIPSSAGWAGQRYGAPLRGRCRADHWNRGASRVAGGRDLAAAAEAVHGAAAAADHRLGARQGLAGAARRPDLSRVGDLSRPPCA